MVNQRFVRGTLGAALVLLVACGSGESTESDGSVGSVVLPLEARGSDGANVYRLIANFTIAQDPDGEGGEPPVEITQLRARNSSPRELVEVLPIGSGYTITLEEGDEIRRLVQFGETEPVPDGLLIDERTKSFEIGTEPTVVTYTYEIGGVAFGFGELDVRFEVLENPIECPCWNGSSLSAPCGDGPCRSVEEAYATYVGPNCDDVDQCRVDDTGFGATVTSAACDASTGAYAEVSTTLTGGPDERSCRVARRPGDPFSFFVFPLDEAQYQACRNDIVSFAGVNQNTDPCGLPDASAFP